MKEDKCPTCGGSGLTTGTANSAGVSGLVPCSHGTGKAPESPEPEATELDEYANLTPREAADKFDKEQESKRVNEAMTAVVREAAKQFAAAQQPEATEPWISNHGFQPTHPGSSKCTDCPSKKVEHLYPAPDPTPQPQQNAGELENGPGNGLMDATLHDIVWAGTQFSTIREVLCKDEQESAIEALIARRELAAVELFETRIRNMLNEANKLPTPYRPDTGFARGYREALIQLLNHEDEPNPNQEGEQ